MQFGLAGTGNARFDVGGEALEGLGGIASESLEQSNVDMATEFVEMILTQKGFQANGKVVTTSDEILKMLNQMKR
jgi:flagellar hook protein FlgE